MPGKKTQPSSKHRVRSERPMARFYEPLVLLHCLGATRGDHVRSTMIPESEDQSIIELRRRFLDDLSYVCDYEKGGERVTAIAIEDTPQRYVFWLASNANPSEKLTRFLREVLDTLRRISVSHHDYYEGLKQRLVQKCIDFSSRRIKDYWSLFSPVLARCLQNINVEQDHELYSWLEDLQKLRHDPHAACKRCYDFRHSALLKGLCRKALGDDLSQCLNTDATTPEHVRHYIGRLGYHHRAVETLAAAAVVFDQYFIDYQIRILPSSLPSPTPPTDRKTTLESIVVRMCPKQAVEEVSRYQGILSEMDQKFGLTNTLLQVYGDKRFRPRVHAELLVLDHFYSNDLSFAGSDRYIGCSKPACYCCSLYIQHHPGNFVRPKSHQRLYLSWKPPDLPPNASKKAQKSQLDIMNLIIADVRKDAKNQISSRSGSLPWHPDSTTGISKSLGSVQEIEILQDGHSNAGSDDDTGTYEPGEVTLEMYDQKAFPPSGWAGEVSQPTTGIKDLFAEDIEEISSKIETLTTLKLDSAPLPELLWDSESDGGIGLCT